jgi:hypothetical protein
MLDLTMECHGLKAENIALKGKNRTLEAEQTVQQENAEVSIVGYLGLGFASMQLHSLALFWPKYNFDNEIKT